MTSNHLLNLEQQCKFENFTLGVIEVELNNVLVCVAFVSKHEKILDYVFP
jgi:hypothetical protein